MAMVHEFQVWAETAAKGVDSWFCLVFVESFDKAQEVVASHKKIDEAKGIDRKYKILVVQVLQ